MSRYIIATLILAALAGCTNAGAPGTQRPIPEWVQQTGSSFRQQQQAQRACPAPETGYAPAAMDGVLAEETIGLYRTPEQPAQKTSGINLNLNGPK